MRGPQPDLPQPPSGPTLVTGATGFVGRRMTKALMEAGHTVLAPARAECDLSLEESSRTYLAANHPKLVFHLASTGVSPDQQEDWRLIGREVALLANLASGLDPDVPIIVAGSMAEYGRAGRLSEGDPCTPTALYGIAKLASTRYAAHLRQAGRDIRVVRIFGAYGPGEAPHRLIPALKRKLEAGERVPLSDGLQERDFIHVDDVATGMMMLAGPLGADVDIINLGTGVPVSVRDVCCAIADEMGAPHDLLDFGAMPRRAVDEDLLVADVSLLKERLGWVPPARLAGASGPGGE